MRMKRQPAINARMAALPREMTPVTELLRSRKLIGDTPLDLTGAAFSPDSGLVSVESALFPLVWIRNNVETGQRNNERKNRPRQPA